MASFFLITLMGKQGLKLEKELKQHSRGAKYIPLFKRVAIERTEEQWKTLFERANIENHFYLASTDYAAKLFFEAAKNLSYNFKDWKYLAPGAKTANYLKNLDLSVRYPFEGVGMLEAAKIASREEPTITVLSQTLENHDIFDELCKRYAKSTLETLYQRASFAITADRLEPYDACVIGSVQDIERITEILPNASERLKVFSKFNRILERANELGYTTQRIQAYSDLYSAS